MLYGDKVLKVPESKSYAVTMGEYSSLEEGNKVGLGVMVQGGSGYVWEQENKFFVIGSIYNSLDDANSVINNIKNSNYQVNILESTRTLIPIATEESLTLLLENLNSTIKVICRTLLDLAVLTIFISFNTD
jgi:hypothetical protein